ncbi:hypothetical protein FRC06_000984 [Ceratobasidium sp. 370]|nr:hypothetical protein FRC06_000984 [Ceratobasidium sp. 370]
MATLYAALCIIRTLLGIGPRKDEARNTTDWLKLALAVAAQPEDEESKRLVHVALESNNQEFLDLLRAALDTRVVAAARLADIESDSIECRAFLPGSPALWGWTTNTVAESAILKAGIESAMSASVFDSPSASCSRTSDDVFIGLNSSETMGGATLRDIYAKAWEFHREPLIWTPRGPGAGLGASTWTLTPASLTSQGARKRNRSVSDASESRSSVAGQSPCLHAQRNRIRRDSLHDIFTAIDTKKGSKSSPCAEAGIIPAPPLVTPPLPSALSEPPVSRRPRRSISCTRSHVSSTTAVTVSECSTTQELQGLGLGRSLDRSLWLCPDTPSDSGFGDCEPGKEITSKGKRVALPQAAGRRGLISSAAAFRRNKTSNFKQTKVYRPGITPLQQPQTSVPKRMNGPQSLASATSTKNYRDMVVRTSRVNSLVTGVQGSPAARSQEPCSLRRVRSVVTMTPSPSPSSSRATGRKTPLIGPVPAARRVSTKLAPAELRATQDSIQDKLSLHPHPSPTPNAPRQSGITTSGVSQSRIPRPVSRADSISEFMRARSPSASSALHTPRREPQQLLTPISTVRVRDLNPLSRDGEPRSAGGSSGGSAAAVAARMCSASVFLPYSELAYMKESKTVLSVRTLEVRYASQPRIVEWLV